MNERLVKVTFRQAMLANLLYGCGYYLDSDGDGYYLPAELVQEIVSGNRQLAERWRRPDE